MIAGFGPTYAMSIWFANNASMAEGPALNTNVSILIPSLLNSFWKSPLPTPITAWAWFRLGKYPILMTFDDIMVSLFWLLEPLELTLDYVS